ncbi:MAG: alpha/beta hydrolase [Bifidobacteriaceae bacterium]|jgi:acetyl esterase|nr:alpha/beta hydrolase [Bifidobacteriaceae bacterium]MCI1979161.1 alpha/beta hydrolase [Bifidobacteriaceae bacterium]
MDLFEEVGTEVARQRSRLEEQAATLELSCSDGAATVTTLTVSLAYQTQVTVYRHAPVSAVPRGIVINFRNSGFVHERSSFDSYFCHRLSAAAGCIVADMEYPLAPVFPFPAAVNCCYWFLDKVMEDPAAVGGTSEMPVMVMGHGAGGNLAVSAQILARRAGKPSADALMLDCPILDMDTPPAEKKTSGISEQQEVALQRRAELFTEAYRRKVPLGDDLVSPVLLANSELENFPRLFLHTAANDPLAAEGERFARRVEGAGSHVTVRKYPDSEHGFMVRLAGRHRQAFDDVVADVKGASCK